MFLVVDGDDSRGGASRLVDGEPLDIQALLEKAQPSVVAIETGQRSTTNVYGGAGSGVVVSDDGLVLTNAHVIGGATEMRATTSSGRTYEAELVGSSPADDVALIRLVDASGLVPAELGSSDDAEVGDEVVAIGNALNLGGPPSVTQGIVSAKERVIEAPQITLQGLLQTDAAINPGNSGGPLLNAAGQVIGINTAIINDAQNIGFAIPIDSIRPLLTDLEEGLGQITPDTAFLGVITIAVDQVNPSVLDQYEVESDEGVFVSELVAGSAAVDAGLQLGDVIVAVDGDDVQRPTDVQDAVQARSPGDEIELEIEREGRRLTLSVTLGSRGTTGD
nr:trypsin-like peptidase domain-containing protein [Rhabdothermincola salaria]